MIENNEYEIDLTQIFESIKKNILIIIIICLVTTTISIFYTIFFIDKHYTATGKLIVVQSQSGDQGQLNYNDVVLSQKLTDTYTQILLSDRIGDLVLNEVDTEMTTKDFKENLKVSSVGDTEVINVSIETSDSEMSALIVNTTLDVFKEEVYEIMSIENVSILDHAKIPENHSSPSLSRNAALGLLLGLLISGGLVVYDLIRNNFVKEEDDLQQLLGIPVIGMIPYHEGEEGVENE